MLLHVTVLNMITIFLKRLANVAKDKRKLFKINVAIQWPCMSS